MIARAPIPIHRAGIVSSLGIGFDTFANAMRDARTADASAVTKVHDPAMPARGARTVSYDAAQLLGVKGLAALNRMSQMAILACEEALPDRSNTATDVGVVLGTSGGSLRSITDFVRSTYAGTQPHMISPLQFPNTVMNCAAAQCAIRFGLTGVNSTVCGGELSSLVALLYAVRALRAGHCGTIIAGGIEEYCDFTAWSHEASIDADDAPIGEGAAAAAQAAGAEVEVLTTKSLSVLEGRRIGEEIQARPAAARPDAVFAANDLLAVGLEQAFIMRGSIAVPEEIAIVGYDDIAFAESAVVPLTSVRQPAQDLGRRAFELLTAQVEQGQEIELERVEFTPELVVRQSTVAES